jgi:hypothetical protein
MVSTDSFSLWAAVASAGCCDYEGQGKSCGDQVSLVSSLSVCVCTRERERRMERERACVWVCVGVLCVGGLGALLRL